MLFMVLLLFLVVLSWWYTFKFLHPRGFPPGPRLPLPLLGDSLTLDSNFVDGLDKLRIKYGDVVGFYLGPMRAILISDLAMIQEACSKEEMMDRPQFLPDFRRYLLKNGELAGIGFSNGINWTEQRRFTLHKLRDFGFGKANLERVVEDQAEMLCQRLKELTANGEPVSTTYVFQISTINALWTVLTGETIPLDDPKIVKLNTLMDQFEETAASPIGFMAQAIPMAAKLANKLGLVDISKIFNTMEDVCISAIESHKADFELGDIPRDFIDAYLQHQANPESGASFHGEDGTSNLVGVIVDLFAAGSATISMTLTWAVLLLANRPELQKILNKEIHQVTAGNRLISYSERTKVPLVEAFILEVQRKANVAPFSLFRQANRDCQFQGYFIPKGTVILPNIGRALNNPEMFENPEEFKPERYIKDGKFSHAPNAIPFGVGKRRCLGETLAKAELFIYITRFLYHFDIKPDGDQPIRETLMPTAFAKPYPFKVKLTSKV
uniref:Methyl farnesoate epoxidase/farnesoate epoxidase n=1 Tax=Tigriopus japonicus TaxID=158387 RepID=A0A9E9FUX0_TIGJA|nr:methyl farnesoate epoxidase/farnesoate epoxidase [Tigriopus japonicus]